MTPPWFVKRITLGWWMQTFLLLFSVLNSLDEISIRQLWRLKRGQYGALIITVIIRLFWIVTTHTAKNESLTNDVNISSQLERVYALSCNCAAWEDYLRRRRVHPIRQEGHWQIERGEASCSLANLKNKCRLDILSFRPRSLCDDTICVLTLGVPFPG